MSGKIKYAPGTLASFFACVLFFILNHYFSFFIIFITILIFFSYSFISINNSFEVFNDDDPSEIVIDEVVGQMVVLLFIPIYETLFFVNNLYYYLLSFIFFRLFDIWKPYPINYVDNNVKGAIGIMMDDIIAAIYSIFSLTLLFFFVGG